MKEENRLPATDDEITILIVDDHAILRENWRYIFQRDPRFMVVGECGSAEEALEAVPRKKPHVVMMDINLPGMDGLEATRQICQCTPDTKVIGVSLHAHPVFAQKMMENGASGYLTKSATREELFEAIIAIHQGGQYICAEVKGSC